MSLTDLPVRGLHRLDFANSGLRHSIVKACFYNLRVLAQALPGRKQDEDFTRKLGDSLGNTAQAREVIDQYFAYRVTPETRIGDLFPEHETEISNCLAELDHAAQQPFPPAGDLVACRDFSQRIVQSIDKALADIEKMGQAVKALRIPAADLLRSLKSIQEERCASEGVALVTDIEPDTCLGVFGDRSSLLNALNEVVENALRHAFAPGQGADRQIRIQVCADPGTRDPIFRVQDNGQGMPEPQLARVGEAGASTAEGGDGIGLVRRIIEEEHFGIVTFASEEGAGTTVEIRLPRRIEPDLGPPGSAGELDRIAAAGTPTRSDGAPQGTRGSGLGLARVAAAVLVVIGMSALGGGLAWYVYQQQKTIPGGNGLPDEAEPVGSEPRNEVEWRSEPKNGTPSHSVPDYKRETQPEGQGSDAPMEKLPADDGGEEIEPATEEAKSPPVETPRTLKVAMDGSGDFARLSEALKAAKPGDKIIVAAGEYLDHLVLDKGVEIVGEGKREAVIRSTRQSAVIARVNGAILRNLRILLDAEVESAAVFVESGDLTLENCEISSKGLSGIEVAGGAPTVTNCVIHQCARSGVFVHDEGAGTFEKNEIRDCEASGIAVSDGANPTFKANVISRCKKGGINVYSGGKGLFETNEVTHCARAAIAINDGGDPVVRTCKLHDNKDAGIVIFEGGKGLFESNHLWGNTGVGIALLKGSAARFLANRIEGNGSSGLYAQSGAGGELKDNLFSKNAQPNQIEEGVKTKVEGNTFDSGH